MWRPQVRLHTEVLFKATRAWFLEIALVRASVCVCVSVPEAINNQWRDMV